VRPLRQQQFRKLVATLIREARAAAPDWTEPVDSDPGIAMLQLFSFLTEGLASRTGGIPARGAASVRRLEDAAGALAGAPRSGCGPKRVTFFSGQLLGAADFRDEQDYVRSRLRRRNRLLHGSGIVSGLGVSLTPEDGGTARSLVLEPGFALDPRGEEIEVCRRAVVPLPLPVGDLLVQVLFAERPVAPVPATGSEGPSGQGGRRYSRAVETFAVALEPAALPDAVPVARLTTRRGRWHVARDFTPQRVRR
jgi:hypothetical protein